MNYGIVRHIEVHQDANGAVRVKHYVNNIVDYTQTGWRSLEEATEYAGRFKDREVLVFIHR